MCLYKFLYVDSILRGLLLDVYSIPSIMRQTLRRVLGKQINTVL